MRKEKVSKDNKRDLLAQLPAPYKALLKKRKMPTFEQPMLATLTNTYFSNKDWIYECKFDGARCLVLKNGHKIVLKSRNDNSLSSTYPEIIEAAQKLTVNQTILDGEIVSFVDGISKFEKLQVRIGVKNPSRALMKQVKIYICIFDILYLDGYDLTRLPLLQRKKILKQVIQFKSPLRYVTHRNEKGLLFFKQACKKGWEGLIAKDKNSPYVHVRSQSWLKFKCVQEQELIICGYTEPQRSRTGFGALLVGYYSKDKKLYYAGKVGTGYDTPFLQEFSKKLQKIELKKNPFANKNAVKEANAHFVKPYFVGEFGFEEWTKDNKLRQGRFLGLRDDKDAKDVVRETPKSIVPSKHGMHK